MSKPDDKDGFRSESKDERLLRKAREYVERQERKKSRRRREAHDDDSDDDRRRRSRKSRKPSRREEGERKRGDESSSRKKSSRSDDDDDRDRSRSKSSRKEKDRRSRRTDRHDHDNNHKRQVDSGHRDDRKKKKRKDDSERKDKHQKRTRERDNDEPLGKKALRVDKSKLFPLGHVLGHPPKKLLDAGDDYFTFHQHLWVYLYREEGLVFGDLTTQEAHDAFQRFCLRYNEGKLEEAYYGETLPPQSLDECKITRHKWSFKTDEVERKSLQAVEMGVRKQTEYDASK